MNSHGPNPRFLAWSEAAAVILAEAQLRRNGGAPVVIGITGPVGAGKSTLASRLGGALISSDSYLPDYERIPEPERDLPERADLSRLASDLAELRLGLAAEVPIWSFQTHRREGYRRVHPAPLVVCEGIHALDERIAPCLDVRIYVEAPAPVRWQRWEVLEATGQRGWGVERARQYFDGVAEPTFSRYAEVYKRAAQFIVTNERGVPSM